MIYTIFYVKILIIFALKPSNMKKNTLLHFFIIIFMSGMSYVYGQNKSGPKINGRIQYDFAFIKREKDTAWFQGNEFRRVHLSATGKLGTKIKYKVEADFAHAQLGFRDVYMKYLGGKYGNFAVGSVPEPTGLEMMTSSKYISFTERAMLTSLQNFRWGAGLHYENFQLFDKKAGVQAALTNNGTNNEGFLDKNLDKGLNFSGRIFALPYSDTQNHSLIHVGVNFASRPVKDLKFRAENHMGDKYHYVFPDAKRRKETGFEAALTYSSFSLQSEYKMQQSVGGPNNYKVTGYYVTAGYFLTGEYRPYKHGGFGRVKPLKDIDHGGCGALEILFRYSVMSFNQAVMYVNPGQPEKIANIGLGLNWYLNSHARIMYNFILTEDGNYQGNQSAHLIRFQIDF